jgi:hypothetical protein
VKRATTGLAILFMWGSLGCATRPPKPYFANGPGPHDFDCDAPPGYYRELNIHATKGKLRLAGFIQVESVHTPQDPHWYPQAAIVFKGLTEAPFVGFRAFVNPRLPDQFLFALRPGLTPSDDSQVFMAMGVGDPPTAFELTLSESHQLTASVGRGKDTTKTAQFDVVRASLSCSGTHVRYSYITISAQ